MLLVVVMSLTMSMSVSPPDNIHTAGKLRHVLKQCLLFWRAYILQCLHAVSALSRAHVDRMMAPQVWRTDVPRLPRKPTNVLRYIII